MADSILRLKVESSEYDNKLKRAVEGIQHLADVAHKSAGEMTGLEQAELDYIRSLGEMETKSRSAAGSTRELESAYKELSVIYNKLNEVEKADEGGKALAASLEQIKQRAQESRAQLEAASKSLQENSNAGQQDSSVLEQLASKFTLNIDALKLFDYGLSAVKAALDVAKEAFFSSEANVDEWGRVMDSSKSLYEGFLTALNTGDISGYLSRIDSIVQAARAAYNELDRLGTMKTIQAPQVSAQQTENERMRMMIQTGRYIAPVDGRKASMQNGQLLTPEQITRIEKQLQNGMQKVVTLVGNEVKQTGRAIDAVYNRQAQELGMSLKEFRKGTSSMAEFDKRMAGYDQYSKWRAEHTTIDQQSGREIVARVNPFEQFAKWGTFRVDGQRYNDLVKLIQQRDQQAASAYGMQSQAYRTMNRAEGVTVRQIMGGSGGGGRGGSGGGKNEITYAADSIMAQEKEVARLTEEWKRASEEMRDGILKDLDAAKEKLDEMMGKANVPNLNELFPDLSAQNYNTGYAGSVEARITSAKSDLAQSPANLPSIDDYISLMKSAASDVGLGTETAKSIADGIADAQLVKDAIQRAMEQGVEGTDLEKFAERLKEMLANGELSDEFWNNLYSNYSESTGKKMNVDTSTGEVKEEPDKEKKYLSDGLSKLSGGLSGIQSGFQQFGIDLGSGFGKVVSGLQGITTILMAIQTIVAAIEVISSIDAIFPFAHGGIVGRAAGGMVIPGNAMSGDNFRMPLIGGGMIGVNSGELILNQAQQGVLASLLESGESAGVTEAQPYVTAETIFVGLKNLANRWGGGEIIIKG